MNYTDNEIPKYKKKSTKTVKKSKHKHTYKNCLIYDKNLKQHFVGEYCTVCNKIGSFKMSDTASHGNNYSRILSEEELVEKYKDYEVREVNDIFKDKEVL